MKSPKRPTAPGQPALVQACNPVRRATATSAIATRIDVMRPPRAIPNFPSKPFMRTALFLWGTHSTEAWGENSDSSKSKGSKSPWSPCRSSAIGQGILDVGMAKGSG